MKHYFYSKVLLLVSWMIFRLLFIARKLIQSNSEKIVFTDKCMNYFSKNNTMLCIVSDNIKDDIF